MKKEGTFKKEIIDELEERFPDCIILKNDPTFIQGIPDITILWKKKWASLETKKSKSETYRPNQEYYISKMNNMSFSRSVYPENREDVLNDLERFFKGV